MANSAISVVHVVASVSHKYGGPSYTVPALKQALSRIRVDAKLRSVVNDLADVSISDHDVILHPPETGLFNKALRASKEMQGALVSDANSGAVLHAHGLWLMPNIYPSWAQKASRGSARLVHSLRGMLSKEALQFSFWKKYPFWLLLQKSALEAADCLHATADSEYEEIRAAGLRNPVAIIPNGVDLPIAPDLCAGGTEADRVVLSLGRLHPKKGLDRLIRAWSMLDMPDWRLRIVGSAEQGYDEELRTLCRSLGAQRVSIEGPIFGEDKLSAYRAAGVFVLPSLNENFALTVAEALAAGTPVISTKGAPWAGLEANQCGWWIDHGAEPLASALRVAMTLSPERRREMGARGRAWVARDFSWDRIAADMAEVYRWLKDGGRPPSTVRLA